MCVCNGCVCSAVSLHLAALTVSQECARCAAAEEQAGGARTDGASGQATVIKH